MTAARIAPCLWFTNNAVEAATFYAATFPNSHIDRINRAPMDYPDGKAGDEFTVEFTVLGMKFVGLNGGPNFPFTWAVSFQVFTETQEETDSYWNAIINGGGTASRCSWCQDRFGLWWQITPRVLTEAMSDPDTAAARRAMTAMMTMGKIDIATIEAARKGA